MDIAAERAYPTPFANSPLLPLLLMSLATQRNSPKPATTFKDEYDYIIVGAGSAGSVVASRLSDKACVSILLLEAGKPPPLLTEIPSIGRSFWFTDIDWQYKTVPQKHTGYGLINRQLIWPSGKALGGSSIINAMLYVRGNMKNYDNWVKAGAKGWGYDDVFPYFVKLEDNTNPQYVANGYHGVGGPMTMEKPRYYGPIKGPIFQTAANMGYRIGDINGPRQTGFYDLQGNTRNGQRCSTAKAYLVPVENRTNIHILPNAHVTKILIDGGQATGVRFDYGNATHEVKARREVILSAGTINSAQLLMLSGVGPKKHLRRMKIPVKADLPVGNNLQDHCATFLGYTLDPSIPTADAKIANQSNLEEYIKKRSGPVSSLELQTVLAFLRNQIVNPKVDFPNYELYFVEVPKAIIKNELGITPEVYQKVYEPYVNKSKYVCLSQILNPKSRGTVRLKSSDPYDPPLIDPNYFDKLSDLQDVVEGMKACHKIAKSDPLKDIGSKPFEIPYPGCEKYFDEDDQKYFECQARSAVITLNHQVGTCRMGDPMDPRTVVDTSLRVKNIKNLRVVDASIMPIVPSGNTNIPTIMVAEKASDIIKETIPCSNYGYQG